MDDTKITNQRRKPSVVYLTKSKFSSDASKRSGAGINILDQVTQRSHDPETFLFFNQVPTAYCTEVYMNEDRTISLITDGDEIGKVSLYPMTRRHVKEVRYFYPDGTIDFIEEYAADGKLFSTIYYCNDQVQEIAFSMISSKAS